MEFFFKSLYLLLTISPTIIHADFISKFLEEPTIYCSDRGNVIINGVNYCDSDHFTRVQVAKKRTTKKSKIPSVDDITIKNSGRLIIKQCATCEEELEIDVPENVMEYVQVSKHSNTLCLGIKNNIQFSSDPKIVYIATVKNINTIKSSGAVGVDIGQVNTKEMKISGSGKASIRGKVAAERLQIKLSGASSGNVDYTGKELDVGIKGAVSLAGAMNADLATINLSGATVFRGLKVSSVEATLSGSSYANIDVAKSLLYTLKKSSLLVYGGSPSVQGTTKGSAQIKRK